MGGAAACAPVRLALGTHLEPERMRGRTRGRRARDEDEPAGRSRGGAPVAGRAHGCQVGGAGERDFATPPIVASARVVLAGSAPIWWRSLMLRSRAAVAAKRVGAHLWWCGGYANRRASGSPVRGAAGGAERCRCAALSARHSGAQCTSPRVSRPQPACALPRGRRRHCGGTDVGEGRCRAGSEGSRSFVAVRARRAVPQVACARVRRFR